MTASQRRSPDVASMMGVPVDRVVQVHGLPAEALAITLARRRAELPAPVVLRLPHAATPAEFVSQVLDDLESAAIGLFPAWLPGADHVHTSAGAGLIAVRAIATIHADTHGHSGPFLSDLAAVALGGQAAARRRYAPEYRAAGLVRVIGEGLGHHRLVLIVDIPSGLDHGSEQVIAAGCSWLADHGRLGVWLAGAPLRTVDWLTSVSLTAPGSTEVAVPPLPAPVLGSPHPRSAAEAALEEELASQAWAFGRRWNQTYQSHVLRNPVRLDLIWPEERCVVEIDGPEHCEPVKFDADRRRDVQLQLDGYAVLRFTNARVRHDVQGVVAQIGQFIKKQRESEKGKQWPTTT